MRITRSRLDWQMKQINELLGTNVAAYTKIGDKYHVNVGNWSVGHCLGGYMIEVMDNTSGGISTPLPYRLPAREMDTVLEGIRLGIQEGIKVGVVRGA